MRVEEFHRLIREQDTYETDPHDVRSVTGRVLGRFDGGYHLKVLRVVLSAYTLARRGCFNTDAWARCAYLTLQNVEDCGGTIRIFNLQRLARLDRPAVYVANHMSALETMALPGILMAFGNVATIVKDSLLRYPLFGRVLTALAPISVSRRNPREDLQTVLKQGAEALRMGRSVLVFPQATRSPVFRAADFNTLGVKLARRAHAPMVAVALKTDFHGVGRYMRDFGPIHRDRPVLFAFGEPVEAGGDPRNTHRKVLGFITAHLRQWGSEVHDAA